MLSRLKKNNIRTIVIHKNFIDWQKENCLNVLAQATTLFPPISLAQPPQKNESENISSLQWLKSDEEKIGLFFPKSGTVYIRAIYFPKTTEVYFSKTTLGGKPFDMSFFAHTYNENEQILTNTSKNHKNSFDVKGGDILLFSIKDYQTKGFVAFFYSYGATEQEPEIPFTSRGLEKVYEDEYKEVYWIQ
jgi:hypothetical protein